MKLVVGLGNPGKEYARTRHNVGFIILDELKKYFVPMTMKENFQGEYWETIINSEKIIFFKPLTYMNLSGMAVRAVKDFFKISLHDILIIYDDKDLAFGKYKLKNNGSAGGHNGMSDIINKLGTNNLQRLKIGIDRDMRIALKDWVLSNFKKEQITIIINNIVPKVADVLNSWSNEKTSFEKLMSLYNNHG